MRLGVTLQRHGFRRAGGVMLGIRVHYPISVHADNLSHKWTALHVDLGLVLWTISLNVDYRFEDIPDNLR